MQAGHKMTTRIPRRRQVSCLHLYNFITGTTIKLAPAATSQFPSGESYDILRPNLKADALVARHTETLCGLNFNRLSEVVNQ